MAIDQYDELEIRCPRLGGEVNFKYCRTCEKPFCPRIIFCWAQRIDIGDFLAKHFSAEEIHSALSKTSSGKLESLIKAMDEAKKLT